MTQAEIATVLAAWPYNDRVLMVGLLASAKTLRGEKNRYPNRYPAPEDICRIWIDDPRCLNLVHVAPESHSDLSAVKTAIRLAGRICDGVQINATWPSPEAIAEATGRNCKRVVLQVKDYLNVQGHLLAHAVDSYKGVITDILLDASCGTGVDVTRLQERTGCAIAAIRKIAPWCGVGCAGGLNSMSLPNLKPLRDEHPGLNLDAESALRDKRDWLSTGKAIAYVRAAA